MPIRQIARYLVEPAAVEKVKHAIAELLEHVKANQPGARVVAGTDAGEVS